MTERLVVFQEKIQNASRTSLRGCPHITSAAGGGEGVPQMLTIADEGGRGGKPNADNG